MKQLAYEELFDNVVIQVSAPTVTAALVQTAGAKPVWHQELFDQALSIFHNTSPAITTPATYEYVSAMLWMWSHGESLHGVSLVSIDKIPPDVLAFAANPDFTIFENVPVQLIGQIGHH